MFPDKASMIRDYEERRQVERYVDYFPGLNTETWEASGEQAFLL